MKKILPLEMLFLMVNQILTLFKKYMLANLHIPSKYF